MKKKRGETHIEHREKSFAILVLFHLCIISNAIVLCFTLSSPSSFFHIRIYTLFVVVVVGVSRVHSFILSGSLTKTWNSILHTDRHTLCSCSHYAFFLFFSSPLFSFFLNFFFLLQFCTTNKHTKKLLTKDADLSEKRFSVGEKKLVRNFCSTNE